MTRAYRSALFSLILIISTFSAVICKEYLSNYTMEREAWYFQADTTGPFVKQLETYPNAISWSFNFSGTLLNNKNKNKTAQELPQCTVHPSELKIELINEFEFQPSDSQFVLDIAVYYPESQDNSVYFYVIDSDDGALRYFNLNAYYPASTIVDTTKESSKPTFTYDSKSVTISGNTSKIPDRVITNSTSAALILSSTTLIVAINNTIQKFEIGANPSQMTLKLNAELENWDTNSTFEDIEIYKNFLFVSTGSAIQIYNLSGNTQTLSSVKNITKDDYPNSESTIDVQTLAVDEDKNRMYIGDRDNGLYFIDLSEVTANDVTKTSIFMLKFSTIENFVNKTLEIGTTLDSIIVGLNDENSYLIKEYAPENPANLSTTSWKTLRVIDDLNKLTNHLSVDDDYLYTTTPDLFIAYKHSIPQSYISTTQTTSSIQPELNLLIALPFSIDDNSLIFAPTKKGRLNIYGISNADPFMYCQSVSNEFPAGRYLIDNRIVSPNCTEKDTASDLSPLSVCVINFQIDLNVYRVIFKSTKTALIVGLSVGLGVAMILLFFCVYYFRKTKNYERLNDLGAGRPNQGGQPAGAVLKAVATKPGIAMQEIKLNFLGGDSQRTNNSGIEIQNTNKEPIETNKSQDESHSPVRVDKPRIPDQTEPRNQPDNKYAVKDSGPIDHREILESDNIDSIYQDES